jgi:ABC-type Fe3+-hydroxamate transport system substrate-binding protein
MNLARPASIRRSILAAVVGLALLPGCGAYEPAPTTAGNTGPATAPFRTRVTIDHARLLSVEYGDDHAVIRVRAPLQSWSGARSEAEVRVDAIVLVPRGRAVDLPPPLASLPRVEVPLRSVAVNAETDEAFLTTLGADDRIVAVGGLQSWNDGLFQRASRGEIAQIGYTWHQAPNLEVLLARKPDALLIRLVNLDHAPVLDRARALGIPTIPIFSWAEPDYLGSTEWIELFGLLLGVESTASAHVAEVARRVDAIRAETAQAAAAGRPKVLWAYYAGNQRWIVHNGGPEGRMLQDAGADDLAGRLGLPWRDGGTSITTERLLAIGRDADVWIIGDPHALGQDSTPAMPSEAILGQIKAWREGRLYHNYRSRKPERNAFDWYSTLHVRPDEAVQDLAQLLYPSLARGRPLRFFDVFTRPQLAVPGR